jgi:hypothetical protein
LESILLVSARSITPKVHMQKTKLKIEATDEAAEQALWDCLNEVPFLRGHKVEQRLIAEPGKPEIIAKVKIGEREKIILGEVRPNGQPRAVRDAIASLSGYLSTYADAYGVVLAPLITAESQRICRQEGVGYVDLAGNCLLNFDFVFVSKSGRTEAARKQASSSWYSPRAERVVRALLLHPARAWKIPELANAAMVKLNQALQIKEHLARRHWIENGREGFVLSEPDLLLDEWADNYLRERSSERRFKCDKSVVEIEQALAGVCQAQIIPYALMGFSAAMRFDPLLNYKRVSAYVLSDVNKIVSALELSADAARGNVSLWVPYDEGVLQGAQEFLGVRVTSPAQTYLDLMDGTARGEKAAHLLWETCLKDKWTRKVDGNTTLITCAPAESAEEAVAA